MAKRRLYSSLNWRFVLRTARSAALMPPQPAGMAPLIADQSIDGTGTSRRAYKITSDLPIVAYQFNPLDNVDVFSNDGSLSYRAKGAFQPA
jgi:hypothetical protein